jgi:hypothetical protein
VHSSRREPSRRVRRLLTLLPVLGVLGCDVAGPGDDEPPDYTKVVKAEGKVLIDGKPYSGVVVTFLPPKWSASNGETKADGTYSLQTAGKSGALPGEYKVAISYLVSADGEAQGLAPRSAMSPPPGMATAREKLPAEYSDLSRTTLKATVPATGSGTFDFDIKAGLDSPPPQEPPTEKPAKAGG